MIDDEHTDFHKALHPVINQTFHFYNSKILINCIVALEEKPETD